MFDEMHKKAKSGVLDEIMKLMDEKMGEGLKAKSPKFMSVEVEAKPEDEMKPEGELMEKSDEPEMEMTEPSDEEKQKIRELYERYCR